MGTIRRWELVVLPNSARLKLGRKGFAGSPRPLPRTTIERLSLPTEQCGWDAGPGAMGSGGKGKHRAMKTPLQKEALEAAYLSMPLPCLGSEEGTQNTS